MSCKELWILYYFISCFYCASAVHPACICVRYESDKGFELRKFTSPNFPKPYRQDISCILFTFVGKLEEIVEINFLQFDLQKSRNGSCSGQDYVRIYSNVKGGEINEQDIYDHELCGSSDNMKQRTFFSAGRALIFEFHTGSFKGNHTGFEGNFRFLRADDYLMKGARPLPGSRCTWSITSEDLRSSTGRIFSPQYPRNYPKDSNCNYHLNGKEGEVIYLLFENIRLTVTEQSCGTQGTDYIEVYNGIDNLAPVIATYCNLHNQEIIYSSGKDLYIKFVSSGWVQDRGFAAKYTFHPKNKGLPSYFPNITGDIIRVQGGGIDQDSCNRRYLSYETREGIVNGTNSESGVRMCKYTFEGVGRERVQIIFEEFDLRYPPELGDPNDPVVNKGCKQTDHLNAYVWVVGYEKLVRSFCGKKKPPNLMSNDVRMTLEFKSGTTRLGQSSTPGKGFRLRYKFVENFGIETGTQATKHVCGFAYRSSDARKGNFTSPNYPGLYPKDTECHYVFYGLKDDKVVITFLEFDIEGVSPACGSQDQSDYIEFSNFVWPLQDRLMDRYCSDRKRPPPHVTSDTSYFRVTFKSNSVYERTGFLAQYEFKATKTQAEPVSSGVAGGLHGRVFYLHVCFAISVLHVLTRTDFNL